MKRIVFIFLLISNVIVYSKDVVVGVLEYAPPFSTISGEENKYYGFAIDLMDDICKRVQLHCIYKPVLMINQIKMLNQGAVDILFTPTPISSITSSDYIFSLPFIPSDGHFVTLKENNINNISDLKNKKVGVIKNTLFQSLIDANSKSYSEVKEYNVIADLFSALGDKEVDVIMLNDKLARYIINNALIPGAQMIGDKIPVGEGYGMLTLKKNADLIKNINSALLNMETDGTYVTIYNKYFGSKF